MSWPSPTRLVLGGAAILGLAVLAGFSPVPMSCSPGPVDTQTCVRIEPLAAIVGAGIWLGMGAGILLIGIGFGRGLTRK